MSEKGKRINMIKIYESNSLKVGDYVRFMHAGGSFSEEIGKILSIDKNRFCTVKWSDGDVSREVDANYLVRDSDIDDYEDEIDYFVDDYDDYDDEMIDY